MSDCKGSCGGCCGKCGGCGSAMVLSELEIAMLLQLVEECRSVRLACSRMQISYSTGWNLIRTLESQLSYPLLLRTQGGPNGSQSCLTDQGRELLARYTAYRSRLQETAKTLYDQYFGTIL